MPQACDVGAEGHTPEPSSHPAPRPSPGWKRPPLLSRGRVLQPQLPPPLGLGFLPHRSPPPPSAPPSRPATALLGNLGRNAPRAPALHAHWPNRCPGLLRCRNHSDRAGRSRLVPVQPSLSSVSSRTGLPVWETGSGRRGEKETFRKLCGFRNGSLKVPLSEAASLRRWPA